MGLLYGGPCCGGKHYHMALNLRRTRRWQPIKNYIYNRHKISVNFATENCGYVAVYMYVCKGKHMTDLLHSPGCFDMSNISSPVTKNTMEKFQLNAKKRRSSPTNTGKIPRPKTPKNVIKKKRLTNCDVSYFMTKNNIQKESELMQAALQRSENGEKDIQAFILNKSPKALSYLIATTWKMQAAPETVAREHCTRISVIRNHAAGECAANCQGEWLRYAKEVLQNNKTNVFFFACALRNAFLKRQTKKCKHSNSSSQKLWEVIPAKSN